MTAWEYRKIDLSQHGPRSDELDLLNAAGGDGWELVGITSNSIAYLKRPIEEMHLMPAEYKRAAVASTDPVNVDGRDESEGRAQGVKVKYRDPQTNETWSGRGRMANWLKRKQDAGEDIEEYLVA